MKIKQIVLIVLLLVATGCFNEEMTFTAYLETDGSVTFQAFVENVYSVEKEPAKRAAEEAQLKENLLSERDIMLSEHLMEGGARRVSVSIIRDRVPYAYMVEAEFDSMEKFLEMLGGEASHFTVERGRKEDRNWIRIYPDSFRAHDKNEGMLEDEDTIIRLIIVDTIDVTSDTLRHVGENGVILSAHALENQCEITWEPRKKPAPQE